MLCQKCGKEFPMYIVIDGKKRCLSSRSFCLDCSPFKWSHLKDQEYLICPQCNRQLSESDFYFKKHKQGVKHWKMCKDCLNTNSKILRDKNKQMYVNYAGGKCSVCGYNKCLGALEFHHLDPSKKDFIVSKYKHHTSKKAINKMLKEIDKCILLCSNCHREIHELKLK